jgi:cytochrome P450
MADLDSKDFFTDLEIAENPIPYLKELRSKCPVLRERKHGVMMVTGYDEAFEVLSRPKDFSSCVAITGPIPPLPFTPQGDDITAQIKEHHDKVPWATHFITMDQPEHTARRTLLTRLLTHARLARNEAYMRQLADRLIDRFIDRGACDVVEDYTQAFVTLVIADLLGVPEADRAELQAEIGPPPGMVGDPDHKSAPDPLAELDKRFTRYMQERRITPQDDMISDLANARFPDGSVPDIAEVVRIATFLFVAGQDTSAKLITSAFKILAERPELQDQLRADHALIPDFIEEALRFESPSKVNFRLAAKSTQVGGVDIPAGSVVMIGLGVVNRDPHRFEQPDEFRPGRPHQRDHIAFGRGAHACPGAPLARLEARVTLEHFLDRMGNFQISQAKHGPEGARRFEYEKTYLLNGLVTLNLEFTKSHRK